MNLVIKNVFGQMNHMNRDPHRSASSELSPYLVWRERFSLLCLRREWALTWPRMDILTPLSRRAVLKGSPGAWSKEHTGFLSQLIQEAKEKKGSLTVVWLDFANAYGSIPHNLIQVALDYYHIPHNIQGMITSYLRDIKLRFQSAKFTTKWQPVEKGIVTGCTISPILFIMGINLIISAASTKSRGPKTTAGCQQPAIREFMDDLTVITPTHVSEDLTWTAHIQTQVKKARQRLYHLRQLRKFRVSPAILKTFYSGAIESVLTQCISVWYSNATNQDCKALQRVVSLAERISGSALPSLQDIYLKRCKSRAAKIIKDSNHPGNRLFTLLPSGKRFRSMMARTERLRRSFYPQAIRLLNS